MYSDISIIKDWFEGHKTHIFLLYRGSKRSDNARIAVSDDMGIETAEKAWTWLERALLSAAPGTTFTISVPRKGEARNHVNEIQFQQPRAVNPWQQSFPQLGGFNHQPMTGEDFERRLKDERRLWDLEREVDDLRTAQAPSWIQGVVEKLLDNPTLAIGAINALTGRGPAPGYPAPITGGPDNDDDDNTGPDNAAVTRVNAALEALAKSGFDPVTVVEKAAALAKTNPEMAKSLLQYATT